MRMYTWTQIYTTSGESTTAWAKTNNTHSAGGSYPPSTRLISMKFYREMCVRNRLLYVRRGGRQQVTCATCISTMARSQTNHTYTNKRLVWIASTKPVHWKPAAMENFNGLKHLIHHIISFPFLGMYNPPKFWWNNTLLIIESLTQERVQLFLILNIQMYYSYARLLLPLCT